MNEQRIWLDYPIYRIYQKKAQQWEAAILLPTGQTPIILNGKETAKATIEQMKETYGTRAKRLSDEKFQGEEACRITHSEEIRALLKENWTGQDLTGWHVYGSILRPMDGINIDNTVFLNGNGAKYASYTIYTYVVAQEPLDAETLQHYTLVTISHP